MKPATALTTFTQYSLDKGSKREVAIDPKMVRSVRETVHGSVVINYPGKQSFEVTEKLKKVVDTINAARM